MQCPFEILGLEKSASLEEIDRQWRQLMRNVHPDKTNENDHMAKKLNAARDDARQMHDEDVYCKWERDKKEGVKARHQKEVLEAVKDIFANEIDKIDSRFYFSADIFARKMQALPPEVRKEAEDIFQHGMGDARSTLSKAEERISKLQHELHTKNNVEQELKKKLTKASEENAFLLSVIEKQAAQIAEITSEKVALVETYEHRMSEMVQQHQDITSKQTNQINELTNQLRMAKEHLEEMVSNAESESTEAEQLEGECKRKKHKSMLIKEQAETMQDAIIEFIENHMAKSSTDQYFLSTHQVITAFTDHGYQNPTNQNAFTKELRNHIVKTFPGARASRRGRYRGYYGIEIKK